MDMIPKLSSTVSEVAFSGVFTSKLERYHSLEEIPPPTTDINIGITDIALSMPAMPPAAELNHTVVLPPGIARRRHLVQHAGATGDCAQTGRFGLRYEWAIAGSALPRNRARTNIRTGTENGGRSHHETTRTGHRIALVPDRNLGSVRNQVSITSSGTALEASSLLFNYIRGPRRRGRLLIGIPFRFMRYRP